MSPIVGVEQAANHLYSVQPLFAAIIMVYNVQLKQILAVWAGVWWCFDSETLLQWISSEPKDTSELKDTVMCLNQGHAHTMLKGIIIIPSGITNLRWPRRAIHLCSFSKLHFVNLHFFNFALLQTCNLSITHFCKLAVYQFAYPHPQYPNSKRRTVRSIVKTMMCVHRRCTLYNRGAHYNVIAAPWFKNV